LQSFLPKLRRHLFPRIILALLDDAASSDLPPDHPALQLLREKAAHLQESERLPLHHPDHERILFQSDRLYRHDILHINYTSYDLRREQDVLNPNTSRKDVMCLRREIKTAAHRSGAQNRFLYARVLGVFHANVAYSGPGSLDMKIRRFDFLWVRWFDPVGIAADGPFESLPRVRFPVLFGFNDSVDFLDPADVLRACHIIPRFSKGRVHGEGLLSRPTAAPAGNADSSDEETPELDHLSPRTTRCTHLACKPLQAAAVGCQLSSIAHEEDDWQEYYVNRYATAVLRSIVVDSMNLSALPIATS
jgi:hypothetical protein